MPELDEKKAFAARLRQALKRSPKKIETATELALQFSLRHPTAAVTPQAAQKWLTGQARPTIDKINTLASWLDVSPQWLRHGITDQKRPGKVTAGRKTDNVDSPTPEELELLRRLRSLPEARRLLVEEIVEQFSLDAESWSG